MRTMRARSTCAALVGAALLALVGLPSAQAQGSAPSNGTTNYGKADCLMENCAPIQSGYLDGYWQDPAVVGSPTFGMLWNTQLPGANVILSQPLTYTPADGRQRVIAMDEGNGVYSIDANTGAIVTSRVLQAPYSAVDAQCSDIVPTIGITSTPVLDAASNTLYLWSKGYADMSGATTGSANGRYKFYALDATTLATKFMLDPQGQAAVNRPTYTFQGGIQLQRAGLLLNNGVVYAAFASHCDVGPYTGAIIAVNVAADGTSGSFSTYWVTQAGPRGTTGAGIWQAGGGLASDGNSVWFATGNGDGTELSNFRSGSQVPGALSMAAVRATLNPFQPVDFFSPSNYLALDEGDADLGSSGMAIWDVSGFLPGSTVPRIASTGGKNAAVYILNSDNLGGFKTGTGGGDNVLQTINLGGVILSTPAFLPLDGGYAYFAPTGQPTAAYKFGLTDSGTPQLVFAGQTLEISDGARGVGHMTTTSLNGQPGTGILWVTDVTGYNLRVYNAVPLANGTLNLLYKTSLPGGGAKYQRVVPGSGKMFVASTVGVIAAFGSPINTPLTCSAAPFGQVVLGSSAVIAVNCTTSIPMQLNSTAVSVKTIKLSGLPQLPTAQLPAGSTFVFNATWTPTAAAPLSAAITINTINGADGYVTSVPVSVRGQAVSQKGLLTISSNFVQFGGVVPNSTLTTAGGVSQTLLLSNVGLTNITVTSFNLTTVDTVGSDSDSTATPVAGPNYMNVTGLSVGQVIAAQGSVSISASFNPLEVGDFAANLSIATTGGSKWALLTGSAATAGVFTYYTEQYTNATLENTPVMDFGIVAPGAQESLVFSVTNTGDSPIVITKSKPPVGPQILSKNGAQGLDEGDVIQPGMFVNATIQINVSPFFQVNTPPTNFTGTWTMNTDDPSSPGVTAVQMSAKLVSRIDGPLLADGSPRYLYLGCYQDNVNQTRTLPNGLAASDSLTNGDCQSLGVNAGSAFEYARECWAGTYPPSTPVSTVDGDCGMPCTGDSTQLCGGSNWLSVFYDTTQYDGKAFLPGKAPPPPPSVPDQVQDSTGQTWYSAGCWSDNGNPRALAKAQTASGDGMTLSACASFCQSQGASLAGSEFSTQCYCSLAIADYSQGSQTGCNMPCSGNSSEICGGPNLINLFTTNVNGSIPLVGGGTTTVPISAAATSSAGATPTTSGGSATATTLTTPTVSSTATTSTISSAPSTSALVSTTTSSTTTSSTTTSASSATSALPTSSSAPLHPAINSWTYGGCFQDAAQNGGARTGGPLLSASSTMTLETCQSACAQAGGNVFSIENGNECYCSATGLNANAVQASSDALCNTACTGNSTEVCGGPWLISVYSSVSPVPIAPPPVIKQSISNATLVACYSDNPGARILPQQMQMPDNGNSVEACSAACQGYAFFGLEWHTECFCANAIVNNPSTLAASSCNYVCSGNPSEFCGGSNAMQVYQYVSTASAAPASTPAPAATSTTLTVSSTLPSTSSPTLSSTPATTAITTLSQSSIASTSVSLSTSLSSSSSASTSPTSTSTSASSSPSASSAPKYPAVNEWTYGGCFQDAAQTGGSRTGGPLLSASSTMTLETCQSACAQAGGNAFSIENGNECYCSATGLNSNAVQASSDALCSTACTGNSTEVCGGPWLISVYSSVSPVPIASPPVIKQSISNATLVACYSDNPGARILPQQIQMPDNGNSVEACSAACQGYALFGLEWQSQCFCGNAIVNNPSTLAASSCNYVCSGNPSEFCGGSNAMQVYRYLSTASAASSPAPAATTVSPSATTNPSASSPSVATAPSSPVSTAPPSSSTTTSTTTSTATGSSTTSSTASSTTSSSTSSAAPSSSASLPAGAQSFGCFSDSVNSRTLGTQLWAKSSNTPASCFSACVAAGYRYCGTEYGSECWASNFIASPGASVQDGCTMPCAGDSTQTCGGSSRLSILQNTNWKQSLFTIQKFSRWNFTDCVQDSTGSRVLPTTLWQGNATQTAEGCLNSCAAAKYTLCGFEYSGECYAGNTTQPSPPLPAPITGNVTDSIARGCSMPCNGNSTEACGGPSRLQLYTWLPQAQPVFPSVPQYIQ